MFVSLLTIVGMFGGDPSTPNQPWAFQPRRAATPPTFTDPAANGWIKTPIDAFVLSKLRSEKLTPAGEAERRVLIRRLVFDLTGLPPTPKEVTEFVADPAPPAPFVSSHS